jgi:hypothetical protein
MIRVSFSQCRRVLRAGPRARHRNGVTSSAQPHCSSVARRAGAGAGVLSTRLPLSSTCVARRRRSWDELSARKSESSPKVRCVSGGSGIERRLDGDRVLIRSMTSAASPREQKASEASRIAPPPQAQPTKAVRARPRPHLRGARAHGLGPRLIAPEVDLPHATVHRALRRRGPSRYPRPPREAVVRSEWPCPGRLLHMDTKRFQRKL